jgi:hypothetical protein
VIEPGSKVVLFSEQRDASTLEKLID